MSTRLLRSVSQIHVMLDVDGRAPQHLENKSCTILTCSSSEAWPPEYSSKSTVPKLPAEDQSAFHLKTEGQSQSRFKLCNNVDCEKGCRSPKTRTATTQHHTFADEKISMQSITYFSRSVFKQSPNAMLFRRPLRLATRLRSSRQLSITSTISTDK